MSRQIAALCVLLTACSATDTSAAACGSCHTEQYDAWAGSAHARSGRSVVFEAMLPEVREAWGDAAVRRCVACHQPGHGGDEGIGCAACHTATGNRKEADGELVVDANAPIAGPRPNDRAPHAVSDRPFLRASALCATCHEVTGPGLLDEPTGTEHATSGVSESCADCHMPRGPFSHAILGFEPGLGVDPQAIVAEARDLLSEALALQFVGDPPVLEVRNVGAGHHVPTGAGWLRELRIDLSMTGADGRHVELTGAIELSPRPASGGRPVALLTDADTIVGSGLAPGEVEVKDVPVGDLVRPVAIRAAVIFSVWRPEVKDALQLPQDAGGGEIEIEAIDAVW